jgi:hypothetical protein
MLRAEIYDGSATVQVPVGIRLATQQLRVEEWHSRRKFAA